MLKQGRWAGRTRATSASLSKLYNAMSPDQRNHVVDVGFGGLLEIGSGRLPSSISKWLISNFDAEREEIVILGRGRIKANTAAVHRMLALPMGKDEVKYEFNGSAINFINGSCNFEDCRAPRVSSLREKLEANKEANERDSLAAAAGKETSCPTPRALCTGPGHTNAATKEETRQKQFVQKRFLVLQHVRKSNVRIGTIPCLDFLRSKLTHCTRSQQLQPQLGQPVCGQPPHSARRFWG